MDVLKVVKVRTAKIVVRLLRKVSERPGGVTKKWSCLRVVTRVAGGFSEMV